MLRIARHHCKKNAPLRTDVDAKPIAKKRRGLQGDKSLSQTTKRKYQAKITKTPDKGLRA